MRGPRTNGFNVPRGTARLIRAITVDGDAVHDPALAMAVVDRVVLDAAVVQKAMGLTLQRKRQVNSGRTRWR